MNASPWPVTPKQAGEDFDPPPRERPELKLPEGSWNLAANRSVTSSFEPYPILGELEMITDGDKGGWDAASDSIYFGDEGHFVEFGPNEYVQIDLDEISQIDAIWIWHRHPYEGHEVPRDVVVQISRDASFSTSSTNTIFNNDRDGSLGLGFGKDRRYATSRFGKIIEGKGVTGQFVRFWFGSGFRGGYNTLVEVEVYGRTTASMPQQEVDGLQTKPQREADRLQTEPPQRAWYWILAVSAAAIICIAFVMVHRRFRGSIYSL